MKTIVKDISEIMTDGFKVPVPWKARVIINDDNMTYLVWNEATKEAVVVDPVHEDWEALLAETASLKGYRFIGVIDTHTHADHLSNAAKLAEHLNVPLIMHEKAPSKLVQIRVSRDTALPTAAGEFRFLVTPGHTHDSLTPVWGPFVFGGDTLLYAETGRDDLPTGDPRAHYESLQKIKKAVTPDHILLPGHDMKGGRASSWKTQLKEFAALSQDYEAFYADSGSWVGPPPKKLKESLYENFR